MILTGGRIANVVLTVMGLIALAGVYDMWSGWRTAKWDIGDTVCLKMSGKPATVKWYYSGKHGRPPNYQLVSVDNLGRTYEVTVTENDIQECP